ncbi:MAG TPA: diguanylate cyclase [Chloroflexota bacterium]|nr:diguanylate cyclase [Chloroflexota bacterium]
MKKDRQPGRPGETRSTVALALGLASFLIGAGAAAWYTLPRHGHLPTPSPMDLGLLVSYPLLAAGVLFLPAVRSAVRHTRIVLDILLVLTGLVAFVWYLVLGPLLARGAASPDGVVNVAFPVLDLVLVAGLLLLWVVAGETRGTLSRRTALLLGAAFALLLATDTVRAYGVHAAGQVTSPLLNLGRIPAYILVGLALAVRPRQRGEGATPVDASAVQRPPAGRRDVPRIWRYLAPYSSFPLVVALMIHAARSAGYAPRAIGVYLAGGLLIELVFFHQFLDYRELMTYANRTARLETLAAADPVTELANHRTLASILDVELERAHRYRHPCSVLFIDLDHFKALNDSFGHLTGDAALREFASVVRTGLRGIDVLGRWGGEEFVALLPETGGEAAYQVAERIRAAVAGHTFWAAGGTHITCSIGIAGYPEDAESRDELIEMADRAMYAAKRLGRNQVRLAGEPVVATLDVEGGVPGAREEAALLGTVEAFATIVEARADTVPSAAGYPHDAAALATRLALEMGLDTSEAHLVGMAGRLYDIGKVAIPDAVLTKRGHLTEEEWDVVLKHPVVSAGIVSRVPALRILTSWIRAHHEQWDGSGYPDGLAGDAIPLAARILAVADAYEAMTSGRPYRGRRTSAQALREIERCAGSQFDPAVVEALRRVLSTDSVSSVA